MISSAREPERPSASRVNGAAKVSPEASVPSEICESWLVDDESLKVTVLAVRASEE